MFAFRYDVKYNNIIEVIDSKELEQMTLARKWINESFRKVVLGGKKKDFDKIIKELPVFLVRDAGLTEVEPNSETVIATWPILKSTAPKCISRLQTLK